MRGGTRREVDVLTIQRRGWWLFADRVVIEIAGQLWGYPQTAVRRDGILEPVWIKLAGWSHRK